MSFGFNDVTVREKLAHAVELLDTTNKPVSQISQELGFGGDGTTLVTKLVDADLFTEGEIRARAKAIRSGTHVTE